MKITLTLILAMLFGIFSLPSQAVYNEIICPQAIVNKITAPIKTIDDLPLLEKNTSFLNLSVADRKIFRDRLNFNAAGALTSFNYSVLESNLPLTQVYEILSLFGMQHFARKLDMPLLETDKDAMLYDLIQSDDFNRCPGDNLLKDRYCWRDDKCKIYAGDTCDFGECSELCRGSRCY